MCIATELQATTKNDVSVAVDGIPMHTKVYMYVQRIVCCCIASYLTPAASALSSILRTLA
jgi:hypothetical protein